MPMKVFGLPLESSEDAPWVQPDPDNFFVQLENEAKPLTLKNEQEISPILGFPKKHFSDTSNEDVITYHEKIFNRKSSLCWMELIRITEDKVCCNKSVSKEYSIILESPSPVEEKQNIQDDISSDNFDRNNMKNFTKVEHTLDTIITEHRKMICGFGPIFTKLYSKWPNSKKERVEIVLGSNKKYKDAYNPSLVPPFLLSTESSSTFDTVQTPSILDIFNGGQKKGIFNNKPTIKGDDLLGRRSPAKTPGFSGKTYEADSNKVVLKTFVAHRNMSYQRPDNSEILKNPFDDTNLIHRFNRAKKPILFNILFPNDNIFNNLTQIGGGRSYEVTVQLIVTLAERQKGRNGVTLQLTETTYIDVETLF